MIKKSENKKGQMNLSFGMIFSIILIIIFIVFAIYVVIKFLELQDTIKIEQFMRDTGDFQNDIDVMWKSPQGSREVNYSLPTKITAVCFQDDEFENLKFTSENIIKGTNIENLDIEKSIGNEESLCIPNVKGKVILKITKGYGETLVTITK